MKKLSVLVVLITLFGFLTFSQETSSWDWARGVSTFHENGTLGPIEVIGIAADELGNVYATGTFSNDYFFTGIDTLSRGIVNDAIFLIKYNNEGQVQWSKRIGAIQGKTNSRSSIWDLTIAVDPDNNVILGGSFTRDIYFGNSVHLINPLTDINLGRNNRNAFVAKINSDGVAEWARQFGGRNDERINHIATDQDGAIYATGRFQSDSIMFGNGRLLKNYVSSGFGQYDEYFTVKYDKDGNPRWIRGTHSGGLWRSIEGHKIVVNNKGEIIVAGEFTTDSLIIDSYELKNNDTIGGEYGSSDLFFIKYNQNGDVLWANNYGGSISESLHDIAVAEDNHLIITGKFNSPEFSIGDIPIKNSHPMATRVGFFIKVNENFEEVWTVPAGSQYWFDITVDKNGNIYSAAGFEPWVPLTDMVMIRQLDNNGELQELLLVKCGGSDKWGGPMATNSNNEVFVMFSASYNQIPMTLGEEQISTRGSVIAKARFENVSPVDEVFTTQSRIEVFPNPVSDLLNISYTGNSSIEHVKLIDIQGKVLFSADISSNPYQLDVSNMKPGIYFLNLYADNQMHVNKIVVF